MTKMEYTGTCNEITCICKTLSREVPVVIFCCALEAGIPQPDQKSGYIKYWRSGRENWVYNHAEENFYLGENDNQGRSISGSLTCQTQLGK